VVIHRRPPHPPPHRLEERAVVSRPRSRPTVLRPLLRSSSPRPLLQETISRLPIHSTKHISLSVSSTNTSPSMKLTTAATATTATTATTIATTATTIATKVTTVRHRHAPVTTLPRFIARQTTSCLVRPPATARLFVPISLLSSAKRPYTHTTTLAPATVISMRSSHPHPLLTLALYPCMRHPLPRAMRRI